MPTLQFTLFSDRSRINSPRSKYRKAMRSAAIIKKAAALIRLARCFNWAVSDDGGCDEAVR